jgi:hypothetical protein
MVIKVKDYKMSKIIAIILALVTSIGISAAEVPIRGMVSSKCVINTDTPGVFGNPTPNVLSTAAVDGGVKPVIRYDVVESGYYKATITTPNAFTSSPTLADVVNWTGVVTVSKVTDAAMSAYTTNKRMYGNTTEFDLSVAGTVWFSADSKAQYGYGKSFPAGEYKAVVLAECIAL